MPDLPVIALVGAPHTGAQALALALQQRIAPHLAQIIATSTVAYPAPALTLLMGLDLGCPANEELVHAGEFLRLLRELAPEEEGLYAKGDKEVRDMMKKMKKE